MIGFVVIYFFFILAQTIFDIALLRFLAKMCSNLDLDRLDRETLKLHKEVGDCIKKR